MSFFLTWRTFSASDVVVLLLPLLSLPTHHTTTPTSHFCLVSTAWAHTLLLRENRCKPHESYESMTSSAHNAGLTGEEEEDLEEKQGKRRVCGVERKKTEEGLRESLGAHSCSSSSSSSRVDTLKAFVLSTLFLSASLLMFESGSWSVATHCDDEQESLWLQGCSKS